MCCYSIAFSFQSLLSVFINSHFFISIVVNISSYIRLWVGYLNYLYHFIVENVFRDTLFLNGKKFKWTFVNSSLQIILHRRKRRVKTIFMMKSTFVSFWSIFIDTHTSKKHWAQYFTMTGKRPCIAQVIYFLFSTNCTRSVSTSGQH